MPRRRTVKTARTATPFPAWPGLLGLALLLVVLTSWSWRKWGDVFIDFGHELYVPWQLAQGRVLYRDIVYFMGPLSQYFNAAVFTVAGVSFSSLIVVNLAILAGITAAIHALFSRALGPAAGVLVSAVFLCVFGFGHYVRVGNYNYVTPYLHEQTHGVALGLVLLLCLVRLWTRPSPLFLAAAGVALGLTFLTKVEAFVPAVAASATAAVLLYREHRPPRRRALGAAGLFAAAAAVPVAVAFAFLAAQMPPAVALRGIAGNWVYVFDASLTANDPFYAGNLGLDSVGASLHDIGVAVARLVAFGALALILEHLLRGRGTGACAAAGVLVGVGLLLIAEPLSWLRLARALPLLCAVSVAACLWTSLREPPGSGRREGRYVLALWAVFAIAALGKMALKARFGHYGFALAMPATLLVVALAVFVVPRLLRSRGFPGEAWRAAYVAALLVGVGTLLRLSHLHYQAKTVPIGRGGDRMYGYDPSLHHTGAYFAEALGILEAKAQAGDTLLVLPDGVLLNYLLRASNPTPYYLMTPWEMRAFGGEDAVFARIASDAPDYVVLTRLNMSEYGPAFFGVDEGYGRSIRQWVERHYEPVADVGVAPLSQEPWLEIYRRRGGDASHVADVGS